MYWDLDKIVNVDCVEGMAQLPSVCADLVFADIAGSGCRDEHVDGKAPDLVDERLNAIENDPTLRWIEKWLSETQVLLKPSGTLWVHVADADLDTVRWLLNESDLEACPIEFGELGAPELPESRGEELIGGAESECCSWLLCSCKSRKKTQPIRAAIRESLEEKPPEVDVAGPVNDERLGRYRCPLPAWMLGRIIEVCSRDGDLVLDLSAGRGTMDAIDWMSVDCAQANLVKRPPIETS